MHVIPEAWGHFYNPVNPPQSSMELNNIAPFIHISHAIFSHIHVLSPSPLPSVQHSFLSLSFSGSPFTSNLLWLQELSLHPVLNPLFLLWQHLSCTFFPPIILSSHLSCSLWGHEALLQLWSGLFDAALFTFSLLLCQDGGGGGQEGSVLLCNKSDPLD